MKILLLLPLLLGFSVPAIAHNEANGGEVGQDPAAMGVSDVPTSMKQPHARKGVGTGNSERDPAAMGEEGEGDAFVIQGGGFAPPVVGSNGGINSDPEPIPVGND